MTGRRGVVALLGHPVAHSISPQIHNAAFAAAGIDATYVLLDVEPGAVPAAVAGLSALRFLGANVTVPHKRAVYLEVPTRTADAERAGAANTVYWDGDGLAVDNTDVAALRAVLAEDCGMTGGESILLFGAGGAAWAVAVAAGELGACLEVVGRNPASGAAISQVAATAGATIAAVATPDLVVNATPLGMHGEPVPDRLTDLGPGQIALDLVYGRAETPFVAAARAAGATACDGIGMLVRQAAASFERWTRQPAPTEIMAAAAETALNRGPQPQGTTGR